MYEEDFLAYFPMKIIQKELSGDVTPKSGDFLLVDQVRCINWRNDNHNWKLRPHKQGKGTNAPLEAWNALRVNGQREVKVIYINGMGNSKKAKF